MNAVSFSVVCDCGHGAGHILASSMPCSGKKASKDVLVAIFGKWNWLPLTIFHLSIPFPSPCVNTFAAFRIKMMRTNEIMTKTKFHLRPPFSTWSSIQYHRRAVSSVFVPMGFVIDANDRAGCHVLSRIMKWKDKQTKMNRKRNLCPHKCGDSMRKFGVILSLITGKWASTNFLNPVLVSIHSVCYLFEILSYLSFIFAARTNETFSDPSPPPPSIRRNTTMRHLIRSLFSAAERIAG